MEEAESTEIKNNDGLLKHSLATKKKKQKTKTNKQKKTRYSVLPDVLFFFSTKTLFQIWNYLSFPK